jgi:hypothetical protein
MPRKHKRASETVIMTKREQRLTKWSAKRGLPAAKSRQAAPKQVS